MSRLIDADELIVLEFGRIKFVPKEFIDDAPTIEPEWKRGTWVDEPVYKQTMDGKTWDGYTYCSVCKEMHKYGYRSNFCSNCGADMREEIEDAEIH